MYRALYYSYKLFMIKNRNDEENQISPLPAAVFNPFLMISLTTFNVPYHAVLYP